MFRILVTCCAICIVQFQMEARAQTAYLQSSQVFADDIAELIIELDSKIPSLYALDTSVLEADFEVLDISSSVSRMFESGDAFHRMRWRIAILPRHSGNLRVPTLRVGDFYTPVLTLAVVPRSEESISTGIVRGELEAQPENPYVGQQTRITIRVMHNISLFEGGLIEPEIPNSDTYRQGHESRYSIVRNGRELEVQERNLALVAHSHGELRIPPAIYRGRISSGTNLSGSESGAQSRRINRASTELYLNVRPPPDEFSGRHWLPASQLALDVQWDQIADNLQVGDSLGLTLSIEAKGLAAEALPADLLAIDSGRVKIYADQETRSNRFDGQALIARLEQRFVMVITEAGEIYFPALALKWWDVDEETEKVATVNASNWTARAPASDRPSGLSITEPGGTDDRLSQGLLIPSMPVTRSGYVGIVVFLLIAGLLVYVKPVRRYLHGKTRQWLDKHRNRRLLKQACRTGNPALARRALIKWGRARWPCDNINGLYQIETRINSDLMAEELRQLDAALYADRGSDWNGRRLWRLLTAEAGKVSGLRRARERSLPSLYPQRS